LKHLWIIDDTDSSSIFNRNFSYEGFTIDNELIAGLLSALNFFSELQLPSKQGIESIDMGGLTFTYLIEKDYDLLFIAADEKSTNSNTIRSRLEVIKDVFVSDFKLSPEKWKDEYHGGILDFKIFRRTVDTLINQWKQAEKIMSTAESFDLLGVFQQIFNIFINLIREKEKNQSELLGKIGTLISNIKNSEDFRDEPEINKIQFDEIMGWDIINMNPTQISQIILENLMFRLTGEIRKIIIKSYGSFEINEQVFPFLLSNWNLIKKLKIDKQMLNLFLSI
jgi:hypothetical protein